MKTLRLFPAVAALALSAACAAAPTATPAPTATVPPPARPTAAPTVSPPTAAVPTVAVPTVAVPTVARPTVTAAANPTAAPTAQAFAVPAPNCAALTLTPAQTEGPYYKANPPQKASLVAPGSTGERVTLTGWVVDTNCKPVAGAKVDVWQADDKGNYDNAGYGYRGYVLADAQGRYSIETVLPGLYPGRTRHIHVKVWMPNGKVLTSQVYFPDEAANARDGIFNRALLATLSTAPQGRIAAFTFVVAPDA